MGLLGGGTADLDRIAPGAASGRRVCDRPGSDPAPGRYSGVMSQVPDGACTWSSSAGAAQAEWARSHPQPAMRLPAFGADACSRPGCGIDAPVRVGPGQSQLQIGAKSIANGAPLPPFEAGWHRACLRRAGQSSSAMMLFLAAPPRATARARRAAMPPGNGRGAFRECQRKLEPAKPASSCLDTMFGVSQTSHPVDHIFRWLLCCYGHYLR